jgi:hypothetical protein
VNGRRRPAIRRAVGGHVAVIKVTISRPPEPIVTGSQLTQDLSTCSPAESGRGAVAQTDFSAPRLVLANRAADQLDDSSWHIDFLRDYQSKGAVRGHNAENSALLVK